MSGSATTHVGRHAAMFGLTSNHCACDIFLLAISLDGDVTGDNACNMFNVRSGLVTHAAGPAAVSLGSAQQASSSCPPLQIPA
eukprot:15477080-Alexandrium_andersonii.AAC.1